MHFLPIILVLLLAAPVAAEEGVLSSKPYKKTIDLDTSLPKDLHDELPELGDVSQTVMSHRDEERIAEEILREVAVSDEVLQDVEVVDYLRSLGKRLAKASDDQQQAFHFFVVKQPSINAFAMPGGVIGVHTGLFLASNTESELAGVLGHEIGHVTQRHLARMLAKQKTDTFKNIAGLAFAVLAARGNPELANAALTASTAAGIQRQLDYTRAHEREADRVGLIILDKAGFNPRGMPGFFNVLQRGSRFVDGSAPSFLRTHPLTTERISDVENRVANMPYRQVASSPAYYFVKAKLRANSGLTQGTIDQFKNNIREGRYANEAAEHYGLAIAMLRKNDVTNAAKEVQWFEKRGVKSAFVENLKAQVEVARNNPEGAEKIYQAALKMYPENRALIYGYAEHFLAIKQSKKMITFVKNKRNLHPNDPYLYVLLAKAYFIEKKDLLRYQAQGEAYYRQYNLDKAIEQMSFASKSTDGSFYEKSIVEARLKELKRVQKNMKKPG